MYVLKFTLLGVSNQKQNLENFLNLIITDMNNLVTKKISKIYLLEILNRISKLNNMLKNHLTKD